MEEDELVNIGDLALSNGELENYYSKWVNSLEEYMSGIFYSTLDEIVGMSLYEFLIKNLSSLTPQQKSLNESFYYYLVNHGAVKKAKWTEIINELNKEGYKLSNCSKDIAYLKMIFRMWEGVGVKKIFEDLKKNNLYNEFKKFFIEYERSDRSAPLE